MLPREGINSQTKKSYEAKLIKLSNQSEALTMHWTLLTKAYDH
jgi:hypothetical protein